MGLARMHTLSLVSRMDNASHRWPFVCVPSTFARKRSGLEGRVYEGSVWAEGETDTSGYRPSCTQRQQGQVSQRLRAGPLKVPEDVPSPADRQHIQKLLAGLARAKGFGPHYLFGARG